jgi:hypothetical protein
MFFVGVQGEAVQGIMGFHRLIRLVDQGPNQQVDGNSDEQNQERGQLHHSGGNPGIRPLQTIFLHDMACQKQWVF